MLRTLKNIGRLFIVIILMVVFLSPQNSVQASLSFINAGTAVSVASGNLTSVGIPAGIANNDILIVVLHSRDNVVSTMPGDWTLKVSDNGNTTNRLSVWWKRTTGTESAPTITHIGGNSSIARMYAFRGAINSGDPFDVVGTVQSNAGSPISTASITTTTDGAMILHALGSQDDNNWGTFTGVPTTDTGVQQNNNGTDDSMNLTYGLQGSLGATGAAGATQSQRGPDAGISVQFALKPGVTTLATGTDPSAAIVAPGGSVSDVNNFTLQTNTGTETITSVTVNLSTNSGVGRLAITDNSNVELGFTTSPLTGSNTISVSGMSAGTSLTTFKVRVTPLSHASMPAVPGGAHAITAPATSFVGSYTHTGSDTNTNTLTIDNASPANASSVTGSAGNAQVTVSWTNPVDSDYHSVVVLRRATSAVADVPVEGTTYTVGNTIGTATVACVVTSPTASCIDSGLSNGTAYHYKVFSRDDFANYAAGVVPTGSPFTPSLTTFAITATSGLNGSVTPTGVTNVAQGEDQTYTITPNAGYAIATLTIDSVPVATSTSYTFTNVQAPHTIDATFTAVHTIISTAGVGGYISPLGSTVVYPGSSLTYTITPDSGYFIAILTVDSVSIATSTTHTFTNILTDHTIDVTFAVIPPPPGSFSIVATSGSGGTISPPGASVVTQGDSQTYTITPNTGYQIASLTIDSVSTATSTTYTFTNVQTNHTIEATFNPIPGFTLLDTGASRPTTITFGGYAFPGGKVTAINKTLNTEELLTQSSLIQEDGSFSLSFSGILQTLQSFGLIVKDKENRTSQTKYFTYDTRSDNYVFKDILVPPTIDLLSGQVSRGANAVIVGYASPGRLVRLELDGIISKEILAASNGSYKFEIPTGVLNFGTHTVKTRQFDIARKLESDASLTRTFTISRLSVTQADLNGDGKVDIRDWSIFLSRWVSRDSTIKSSIDFNNDGKVDIGDFSIFIKTIRK